MASLRLERLVLELEKPHLISAGPLSLRALPNERDEESGRFVAAQTMHQLLDGVAEVATAASAKPRSISKSTWNASRATLNRLDLPTADAIRRRVGLPWSTVLLIAFTEPARRSRRLGTMRQRADFKGDDEMLFAGLRLVAHRVRKPLDRLTYDVEIAKVDAERVRRGRRPLNLPHSETVVKRLKSWVRACERAGIEPSQPTPPPHTRARPAVELLDEFISKTGLLPSGRWFEQWCRASDIPLGRDARQWNNLVAAVRAVRASRGDETPGKAATRSELPPIPTRSGIGRSSTRRPKRRTREEALDSLRLYAARHLAGGQEPRQKHYYACASKDRELLAGSTLVRLGRFQDLCREAGI
jgi:hypothetical protein